MTDDTGARGRTLAERLAEPIKPEQGPTTHFFYGGNTGEANNPLIVVLKIEDWERIKTERREAAAALSAPRVDVEALRALVVWRSDADHISPPQSGAEDVVAGVLVDCADDLERALASPAPRVDVGALAVAIFEAEANDWDSYTILRDDDGSLLPFSEQSDTTQASFKQRAASVQTLLRSALASPAPSGAFEDCEHAPLRTASEKGER